MPHAKCLWGSWCLLDSLFLICFIFCLSVYLAYTAPKSVIYRWSLSLEFGIWRLWHLELPWLYFLIGVWYSLVRVHQFNVLNNELFACRSQYFLKMALLMHGALEIFLVLRSQWTVWCTLHARKLVSLIRLLHEGIRTSLVHGELGTFLVQNKTLSCCIESSVSQYTVLRVSEDIFLPYCIL